ncbi:GDP-D-mannose pyrophosphorylase [Babesia caballi]|uniref:mannose-1-phosphate guanylyltransferase n=1 Tax=Babesia caballi TaxID=5871 RepID=A0AAV4LVK6_BABCB|nr:GDP-D-mannose pyrophosphorylase [Babesia caballi]
MKCVILAGGHGTRLRPLTLSVPKPFIPFCNRPIMEYQIDACIKAGVDHIILAISDEQHDMANLIAELGERVSGSEKRCIARSARCASTAPWRPSRSAQVSPQRRGSHIFAAGPLRYAKALICESQDDCGEFLVLNSDIICNYPFAEMIAAHRRNGADATILVTKTTHPSDFGVVVHDEEYRIRAFIEKPAEFISNQINAGIYVLSKAILDHVPEGNVSIERYLFPALVSMGKTFCHPLTGIWADIGKPADYIRGQQLFISGTTNEEQPVLTLCNADGREQTEEASKGVVETQGGLLVTRLHENGATTQCEDSAPHTDLSAYPNIENVTIRPPVLIHPSARIARGCVLGPNVCIGPNTVIGEGCRIVRSTILEGTRVLLNTSAIQGLVWRHTFTLRAASSAGTRTSAPGQVRPKAHTFASRYASRASRYSGRTSPSPRGFSSAGPSSFRTRPSPRASTRAEALSYNATAAPNHTITCHHAERLAEELAQFRRDPPPNCSVEVFGARNDIWIVTWTGLPGTVYAGEQYRLKFIFPKEYPLKPPVVYFLQPGTYSCGYITNATSKLSIAYVDPSNIHLRYHDRLHAAPVHAHVYSNGDICMSSLGSEYLPTASVKSFVLSIISMLSTAKEKRLPVDNHLQYLGLGYDAVEKARKVRQQATDTNAGATDVDTEYKSPVIQLHWPPKESRRYDNTLRWALPRNVYARTLPHCVIHEHITVKHDGTRNSKELSALLEAKLGASSPEANAGREDEKSAAEPAKESKPDDTDDDDLFGSFLEGDSDASDPTAPTDDTPASSPPDPDEPAAALSASITIGNSASTTAMENHFLKTETCTSFVAGTWLNSKSKLARSFTMAVKQLIRGLRRERHCTLERYGDASCETALALWLRFFREYGTHVITNITLGGEVSFSQKDDVQGASSESRRQAGLSAQAAKIDASFDAQHDHRSANNTRQRDGSATIDMLGGQPQRSHDRADFSARWAEAVRYSPMPVKMELTPLAYVFERAGYQQHYYLALSMYAKSGTGTSSTT